MEVLAASRSSICTLSEPQAIDKNETMVINQTCPKNNKPRLNNKGYLSRLLTDNPVYEGFQSNWPQSVKS